MNPLDMMLQMGADRMGEVISEDDRACAEEDIAALMEYVTTYRENYFKSYYCFRLLQELSVWKP